MPELPGQEFLSEVAVLAALGKKITAARQRTNLKLASLPRGTKLTAIDPESGIDYGTVSVSNPKPEAYVTDKAEFEKWCRTTYPDHVDTWTEFSDYEAAVAVVAQHAPHLLIVHNSVPGTVQETALVRAASEEVPGTVRQQPPGVVMVRPNEHAAKLVQQMLESASLRLPELEA